MKEWLVYEAILLNKILRNHFLSENMQLNYASFNGLPLIISCTRSWNLAWHLLWRSTTESKNIVKLLAMSQISHTVCCEDDYFPKGKFKLFNSLFHSVYLVLFQNVCFLLPICSPCVICGSYATKINAVLWQSGRHSRRLACSLGSFTFARTACLFQLWIKTSERDYFSWVTPK